LSLSSVGASVTGTLTSSSTITATSGVLTTPAATLSLATSSGSGTIVSSVGGSSILSLSSVGASVTGYLAVSGNLKFGSNAVASGTDSASLGGYENSATGARSVALGTRAKAIHDGSFVFGDGTASDVSSSAANEFIVRASGGVKFYSDSGLTTGVELSAGGGSFSSVSSKLKKENFVSVDYEGVLDKVVALPIKQWNYKTQSVQDRHIGPFAEDFFESFGLGRRSDVIDYIDLHGVALASIKGLGVRQGGMKSKLDSVTARMFQLESDNAQLKSDNAQLKSDSAQLKSDNAQLKSDSAQLKAKLVDVEKGVEVMKAWICSEWKKNVVGGLTSMPVLCSQVSE